MIKKLLVITLFFFVSFFITHPSFALSYEYDTKEFVATSEKEEGAINSINIEIRDWVNSLAQIGKVVMVSKTNMDTITQCENGNCFHDVKLTIVYYCFDRLLKK